MIGRSHVFQWHFNKVDHAEVDVNLPAKEEEVDWLTPSETF